MASKTTQKSPAFREPHPARNRIAAQRATTLAFLSAAAMLSGCHSVPPPTALNQLNAQQVQGYNVFQSRCALCHYERSDQPKNGPALVGLYKKPYLPSGAPANDDRVSATILHGRNMMPAQSNLDPDSLQALLAYLHTI